MKKKTSAEIKKHAFLLAILFISSFLMFLNIGDRCLWGDEIYSATWAKNILKYGYPTANDGRNIYSSDIYGNSIFYNEDYTLVNSPWVENYVIAASFILFGKNTFAARFPFALLGILTIIALYFFALKMTKNKRIAKISIFLLAFYIPFYLYSRTARYHSLTMLLSLSVVLSYMYFLEQKKYSGLIFTILNILLFHTHYIPFFAVYPALMFHFIVYKFDKKKFLKLILFSAIIFMFTFPWFIYANIQSKSAGFGISRLLFGFVYLFAYFSIYVFPVIFYLLLPKILFKKGKLRSNKYNLVIALMILFGIAISIFGHSMLPSFRYLAFLFPFVFILSAQIIEIIRKYNKYLCFSVVLILIFSNYLFILPFKPFEKIVSDNLEKDSDNYLFVRDNLKSRFLAFDYIYEITHHYSTPDEKIIRYLGKNAGKNDIILAPSTSDTIIFYLDLISYRLSLNKDPDWIIPETPYSIWLPEYDVNEILSKGNYEKIIINATDYIYPIDSPNPRTHRFKENKELKTSNTFPQETYPIEIYHLIS